ncbi:MAG: ABC transporter permease [Anaerolineae bacterium]|nr:ABC transporter permease [Anaerolineae bacterium]
MMATNVARLEVSQEEKRAGQSLTALAMRRLKRDRLTLIALAMISFLLAFSFLGAPILSQSLGVSPTRTQTDKTFLLPFTAENFPHVLGTDDLGRDHLSRLLYAGQVSLSVGALAALLSLSIGVTVGIITGYYGGIVDDVVNWIIATLNSIPSLFLLLIVAAVLRPSPQTLIIILGFLGWTGTTRLVRGETLSLREREYIVSARAVGASPLRIMFSHILPNLFSIIIISLALDIGGIILVEAALSFLGLGILPPTPSWGNMLSNSQTFFTKGPYLVVAPGLMIFLTVLCMYIVGDGLRDAFDPTAKD